MAQQPAQSFKELAVWQKSHALVLQARHMNIAQSSLEELRYYFILCGDLSYIPQDAASEQIEEVARMLGT